MAILIVKRRLKRSVAPKKLRATSFVIASNQSEPMKLFITIIGLTLILGACTRIGTGNLPERWSATEGSNRPILAVWRDFDGNIYAPSLRVAIWNDGRILFSKDAPKWGTNLFHGRLRAADLVLLKERVRATGIMDLTRNSYLRPDEPWCCLLLDFGAQKQLLYWDEDELHYYWNERQPVHGSLPAGNFKRCWAQVNLLALSFLPKEAHAAKEGFKGAPDLWYIKQPSQEERKERLPP
jgi:hypothetical protein